jgi:hypothetical protein
MRLWAAALGLILLATATRAQETTLIPFGSSWRYLDYNGLTPPAFAPPPGWQTPGYADAAWPQGPAELGFGDGGEATVLSFGPDPSSKPITYYFRHTFSLASASFQAARVRLRRDDGAAVYVNGVEVGRHKLPPGLLLPSQTTYRNQDPPEENYITEFHFGPSLLQPGTNVVAVEVHNFSAGNVDLSFDLELIAGDSPGVVRGPYLQRASPTGMVVRFYTSVPVPGRVRYGQSLGTLDSFADGPVTTDHAIELSGLLPGTRYYYSVGTPTDVLAGGDAEHFLRTSPPVGAQTPQRFWVIGDSGEASQVIRDVLQDYQTFTGTTETDVFLMLGDNAYDYGTKDEHDDAIFNIFPTLLRKTVLWPTFGNHDAGASNPLAQTGPYFELFTLPTLGESGGLASGTEAYYSFDRGNVHFLVLESHATSRSPQGAMLSWAAADLAQTQQDWVIAYFHHAPYAKGTHDSDIAVQMREMRENALPILEAGGVDLVLAGHSHAYERSSLIDGHYGLAVTFGSQHVVDGGDGCICTPPCPYCPLGGTGHYVKSSLGPAVHEGAVYGVVGSSSILGGYPYPFPHPAMVIGVQSYGAMVIDVEGPRLDARWIQRGGVVRDRFTLLKGGDDDRDLIPNTVDNCRYVPNPDQSDVGGVGAPGADGIGDPCQCGDLIPNGVVDANDPAALRVQLAGIALLDSAALSRCAVLPGQPACDLLQLVVLRRALQGADPGIAQACSAALP